jgi:hypothetical protein
LRYPEPWIALKCTKTSGPFSWEMKPKPFSELNHFTVPVVTNVSLLSRPDRTCALFVGLRLIAGVRELPEATYPCDAEPSVRTLPAGSSPSPLRCR